MKNKVGLIIAVLLVAALAAYMLTSEEEVADTENTDNATSTASSTIDARDEEVSTTQTQDIVDQLSYESGTYTGNSSYDLPNGVNHEMAVNMTIDGDMITEVEVVYNGDDTTGSTDYQVRFNEEISSVIVGQQVQDVDLSRVGGASLTTAGFNRAFEEIKSSASVTAEA